MNSFTWLIDEDGYNFTIDIEIDDNGYVDYLSLSKDYGSFNDDYKWYMLKNEDYIILCFYEEYNAYIEDQERYFTRPLIYDFSNK